MKKASLFLVIILLFSNSYAQKNKGRGFILNQQEYFENRGVNVMAFQDFYPDGHQSGVSIIMHGTRIATNGDLRLEATPGQWSPMPAQKSRVVDAQKNLISTTLSFPDSSKQMKGFNPIWYPDLYFQYDVRVTTVGNQIKIAVDLDRPMPEEWTNQVGFILELYPVDLFGKSWIMDNQSGIFTRQAGGPVSSAQGSFPTPMYIPEGKVAGLIPLPHHHARAIPMAIGKKLTRSS